MASSVDFQLKLLKLMECNICLEKLKNAKVLHCTHSFCKVCLDKLLKFNADGSANITCPLRCDGTTFIEKMRTTNNLSVPVQFKNLMEMLEEENNNDIPRKKYNCGGKSGCTKELSSCCSACYVKLCPTCKDKHTHNDNSFRFIPIKYESRDINDLLPWCEEHLTYATYACQDGLICLYCTERGHTLHRFDSLDELTQQILTWVNNQNPVSGATGGLLERFKSVTELEIKLIREKLLSILKNRKLECMKSYMKFLKEEEERLISRFDTLTSEHFTTYPSLVPTDYVNDIPRFQVFLDRDRIFENVRHSVNASIPRMDISLSEGEFNWSNPLGELHKIYTESIAVNESAVSTTVASNITMSEIDNAVKTSLLKDVEAMIQESSGTEAVVNELDEHVNFSISDVPSTQETCKPGTIRNYREKAPRFRNIAGVKTKVKRPEPSDDFTKEEIERNLEHVKKNEHQSLNYMWGYMGRRDHLIIGIVQRWKNILRVKGTLGETLLHFAARDGCVILMKYLLEKKLIDVNTLMTNKSTPLHLAVEHNRQECVQVLLENNANEGLRNRNGRTGFWLL